MACFLDGRMHGVTLLGQSLSAGDLDCQLEEVQGRVSILSGVSGLGTVFTDVAG